MRSSLLLRYFHPRKMWGYVGIWCSLNTLKSPRILFPKNTLPWWRVFNLAKNTLEWRGFVGISQDYPLKTWTSKQPIGEIPGFEIIPSYPLKYPRSKQGLRWVRNWESFQRMNWLYMMPCIFRWNLGSWYRAKAWKAPIDILFLCWTYKQPCLWKSLSNGVFLVARAIWE
jgi:hypothetical protein